MTVEDWKARYETLSAEMDRLKAENAVLRARVTPEVISDKHRDGNEWLAWAGGEWQLLRYVGYGWVDWDNQYVHYITPTHALPMPPAPEVPNA